MASMASRTRTEVPRSVSLAVVMVLAAVLTPLLTIGLLVAVVMLLPGPLVWGLGVTLTVGVWAQVGHMRRAGPVGYTLTRADDPELFVTVERLCALADITPPELVLSAQRQPNSWVTHVPGRTPKLYLTTGLRELLAPDELRAVLAHELAHIANHDALVMTVVGLPGAIMLRSRGGSVAAVFVVGIGIASQVGTAILSRCRELAADAGAAAITGHPSALASALMKVSDGLDRVPTADLRSAAALNAFNLVPVPHRHDDGTMPAERRLTATHPPLHKRLDALHRLERARH